jgi:hypothetical protein
LNFTYLDNFNNPFKTLNTVNKQVNINPNEIRKKIVEKEVKCLSNDNADNNKDDEELKLPEIEVNLEKTDKTDFNNNKVLVSEKKNVETEKNKITDTVKHKAAVTKNPFQEEDINNNVKARSLNNKDKPGCHCTIF